MTVDAYLPFALIALMTLVATIKLTLTGRLRVGAAQKSYVVFHPLWLGPLVVMVPFVIGRFLKGTMSPFPPTAFAEIEAKAGVWAGALAGISVTTIDLWLFWTTATALITFTEPMSTAYEPIPKAMHKYIHVVNAIAGAFVIYKALSGKSA